MYNYFHVHSQFYSFYYMPVSDFNNACYKSKGVQGRQNLIEHMIQNTRISYKYLAMFSAIPSAALTNPTPTSSS